MVSPREDGTPPSLSILYIKLYTTQGFYTPIHTKGDLTYEKCHPWSRLCSGSYPDMVLHNGTTQTTERIVNPDSEYLKELPSHIRSFEQAVAYWPNQVYIGQQDPG